MKSLIFFIFFLYLFRSFLESEWCILEFKTAFAEFLKDKVHKIIMVKISDLPNDIDPLIKLYMKSATYLTWGENNFWQKLFSVLPRESGSVDSVPRNSDDNEYIINFSMCNL